jgi:hypothetical protein
VSSSLLLELPAADIIEAILDARADQILMPERPLLTTGEPFLAYAPASCRSILILRIVETPELVRRAQAFAR